MKALRKPEEILSEYLKRKKSRNAGYSMRWLARDLKKSPAFISQVLSGKRKISGELFSQLADALEIDTMARRELSVALTMNSNLPKAVKEDLKSKLERPYSARSKVSQYTESGFKDFDLLRKWYYVAILDLVSLKNFKPDVYWISKKLGLSEYQTRTAISDLLKSGMLLEIEGKWKKSHFKLRFSSQASKETIRLFHRQMIEKASKELVENTDLKSFENRLITGHCVAVNPQNIEKAKVRLNEMIFELAGLLSEGECTELYQINAQLFRLTQEGDS